MSDISSTKIIPPVSKIPNHIAIIMDGNGRWATQRFMPRVAGHSKGVEAVRQVVEACAEQGVGFLTLFAFSSENWRRPEEEVSILMRLFMIALEREVGKMHANDIRLKVVGDLSRFSQPLQQKIREAEELTQGNKRLTVTVCANYGGRWDIMQAVNQLIASKPNTQKFDEQDLAYTELYFTDAYWPDFGKTELVQAILSYQQRERRFGRTSAQVLENTKAK